MCDMRACDSCARPCVFICVCDCVYVCVLVRVSCFEPLTTNSLLSSGQSQHDEPERTERQSQENTFSLPAAISNQTVSINGAFNTQEENEDPDFVNAIHFDNNSSSSYEKIDVAAMEAAGLLSVCMLI